MRSASRVIGLLSLLLLAASVASGQFNIPPGSLDPRCQANNATPGLTWCKYNNPFVLSDFLSRNSTDLETNFTIGFRCEDVPGMPHKSCSAIQQIRTGGAGEITNGLEPRRFVIYTDFSGRMLFVDFNTNEIVSTASVAIPNVAFFDVSSVLRNDSGTIYQDMVMVVANETAVTLNALIGGNESRGMQSCTLDNNQTFLAINQWRLVYAAFFPHYIHDPKALVSFAWSFHLPYNFTFANGTTITLNRYNTYFVPAYQNQIANFIAECPRARLPLGIEGGVVIYTLHEDLNFVTTHNVVNNISLLFAYSPRAINLFRIGYEGGEIIGSDTNQTFHNFPAGLLSESCGNYTAYNVTTGKEEHMTRRKSTIFCAPEGWRITTVATVSPDKWEDISRYNRDLWVSIGLASDTSSQLFLFDLSEFLALDSNRSTFDNPLALPDSFGTPSFPCNFSTQAYLVNGSTWWCGNRLLINQTFDDVTPITQVEMRTVKLFMNVHNMYNQDSTDDGSSGVMPTLPPGWSNITANITKNLTGANWTNWTWQLPQLPIVAKEHAEIFVSRGRSVSVFTLFESVAETGLVFEWQNDITFIGDVSYMYPSENAQHLFAAVTRSEWELVSQLRYKDICDQLTKNPDDLFLRAYGPKCAAMPGQEVNLNSFAQYASYCSFNMYCPTLDRMEIRVPSPSQYADRPAVQKICPRGSFCPLGLKSLCPPGFICPDEGMVFPSPCPTIVNYNTTCAVEGLTAPLACPPGVVCFVPHIPGLPTPPGRIMPATGSRVAFEPCPDGYWCPLGASEKMNVVIANGTSAQGQPITQFTCPTDTFCSGTDILEPTACQCDANGNISSGGNNTVACNGRIMFCPYGTTGITWCPAGYYCTSPNASAPCVPSQYCPNGTFAPDLCPKGYYCETPAVKTDCPEGHYCPAGTIVPIQCNFLTVCPTGSVSESRTFLAPFILVFVVGGVLVAFSVFARLKKKRDDEAKTARLMSDSVVVSEVIIDDTRSETSLLVQTALRDGAAVPSSRFTTPEIEFKGMGLTLNVGEAKGKRVLDNVTGVIPAGSFVAVMGPSGSGKSTFMHTLAGKAFYGTRDGTVLINGDQVDLTAFSKVVGFVKQDDIMHRELTVAETLLFNARARYDEHCGQSPEAIANAVCTALDLDHVRETNIGDEKKRGISGGQRKRVNIGMELVALPCILFLDEPTSGLDSSSSMAVCKALRALAESGITVIVVIHQPRYEIFELFHKVLLLAKGGKLVYYGHPRQALGYFESHLNMKCPPHVNPPDFFMDAISGDMEGAPSIETMVSSWARYVEGGEGVPEKHRGGHSDESGFPDNSRGLVLSREAAKKQMPSFVAQLRLFTVRSAVQLSRDLLWFFTDLVLVLVAGFFLGLVFSNSSYQAPLPQQIVNKSLESFHGSAPPMLKQFFDRPIDDPIISEASLTCMAIGMTGVTAALRVFGNEQVVYWREASAGMSTGAYFLAKNITHILFILLSPLLYLAPFLTFVSARASFLSYYRVCVCIQFATTGLGYLISTIIPPGLAQLGGVVAVLVFAMFGGCRPTLPEIKEMFALLRIMPYLSYIRFGQEAMYLEEIAMWKDVSGVNVNPSLDIFGYNLDDYTMCVWAVIAYGVGFRLIALLLMYVTNRDQKH